ncbi:MAG: ParA family partition ATPase [Gammaproteobacteria bacterium]|jgi:chromosome partitioning protein
MPVIAVVGNKGGAGKTTLSINIASGMHRRFSTVLLDADPQRSSFQWREIAERDDIVEVIDAVEDVVETVRHYRDRYDCVVIDCPPSVQSAQARQALTCSDVAVIPVLPSPLDLWATVHVEQELEWARSVNPGIKGLVVVNQLESRTLLSKLIREALAEIELPVAKTAITRRMAFRNAMLQGCSVLDAGAVAYDAAEDINQLVDEVMDYIEEVVDYI